MGERRTLGRFVCGERVASGPVGALHRGRVFGDAGFEKDFSLLVVDEEVARDRAALGRLVRAANGWARLNYPRIAHAHELGAEGDTYYLVSDWVRAATASALLVGGPLPFEAALLVAADAADALTHAHARHDLVPGGILHLGLSPETVLVDGDGNVSVRDFGLLHARVSANWADDDRLVYALRYCAPELLAAGSVPGTAIDQRADVFSLGALLFELLAGRPAFGGARARGVVAQAEASPPSLTGIPPAAGPLLARALEARATARLPSVTEFRAQALALVGDKLAQARRTLAERAGARLPSDVPRPSPLDADADVAESALPPQAIAAPSISDDFFSMGEGPQAEALPPPPSMLPSPMKWGGRPLLPATATVWDPPSTTATTTLEALRRKRSPRRWLRLFVPLALAATAFGGAFVWQRIETTRKRLAAAEAEWHAPAPATSAMTTKVTSVPLGAQLFVDGEPRGTTPQALTLPPGEHRVVVAADGLALWRGLVDAGASIGAQLAPARLPPTLEGEAGLKLVCKTPGLYRVFVDGVDTGRTCPVDERIPLTPGPHHLTLYAPKGDRTVEVARPVVVKDRGASTRIILDEE